jgi:hypothetical protein
MGHEKTLFQGFVRTTSFTSKSSVGNGFGTTLFPNGSSHCTAARGWPLDCGPNFFIVLFNKNMYYLTWS